MFVGDFPGGPVVKILPSNERNVGSILGRGTKIPHVSQPEKKKEHKQKAENIVTNSVKTYLKKIK